MPDRMTWFWTVADIVIWSVIAAEEAYPTEPRIQHTSRITGKVTERVLITSNCVKNAELLRANAIGRVRTWCNGRRV